MHNNIVIYRPILVWVPVYVCMCVCRCYIFMCEYVYEYICFYPHMCLCMYVCMYVWVYVCMFIKVNSKVLSHAHYFILFVLFFIFPHIILTSINDQHKCCPNKWKGSWICLFIFVPEHIPSIQLIWFFLAIIYFISSVMYFIAYLDNTLAYLVYFTASLRYVINYNVNLVGQSIWQTYFHCLNQLVYADWCHNPALTWSAMHRRGCKIDTFTEIFLIAWLKLWKSISCMLSLLLYHSSFFCLLLSCLLLFS